jgi:glycogen debranching enzyme
LKHYVRRCLGLFATACLLALLTSSVAAAPPEPDGPTRSTTEDLEQKRYVAAGNRAYVVGTANGWFPPMGWHIRGEMGGVWAHPIKLLDGYWFSVDGEWLPQAEEFTSGTGYIQMRFPETEGLEITRTEFAPENSPVVLTGLTLENTGGEDRELDLAMVARSDIMAAYPWGDTDPSVEDVNEKDEATYENGTLTFSEPDREWTAMVRGSREAAGGETGDDIWGSVPETRQESHSEFGDGTGGRLEWQVDLGDDEERTLWFAVAGSHASEDEAREALDAALEDPEALLEEKVDSRRELLERTKVSLPDPQLQAAFDWGKLNMADLRLVVDDAEVRAVNAGESYPEEPAETIDSLTGVGGGFPDYPWYFGTDGAYTAYPLIASGQWDTVREHMLSIRDVSRAVNGDTGKVVHEVVSDGSVFFGANEDEGNTNVTGQFAHNVETYWRWTGDDEFLDEVYGFVNDGMRHVTSELDENDNNWPEGLAMVERPGMGSETLDTTAYTWRGLKSLERLATYREDEETADFAREQVDEMESAFVEDWWMEDESLYADSRCIEGDGKAAQEELEEEEMEGENVCEEPDQKLQQRHWINVTPLETGMISGERATTVLDTLESEEFTGENGLYHTAEGGGPDGEGELNIWTLPNSAMAVGAANYGHLGEGQALRYITATSGQLDLEMPGALPELAPSPDYETFDDFRDRLMFMQAWSSYGVQWPVVNHFLGIRPDVPEGSLAVVPDIPGPWPGLAVQDLRVGDGSVGAFATRSEDSYTTTVSAPSGLDLTIGHTLPDDAEVESVTLDGEPVEDYGEVETEQGLEVRVQTSGGQHRALTVTTE